MIMLAGCSTQSGRNDVTPEQGSGRRSSVREIYSFDSLPAMVATSDAVALATVLEVTEGRLIGDPGDDMIQLTEVTLQIDALLSGAVDEPTLKLELILGEWLDTSWLASGEQSLIFLHKKTDPTSEAYYRPINSQGVFHVVRGSDEIRATVDDAFAEQTAQNSLSQILAEIVQANELIKAGQIQEQVPSRDR